MSFPYPFYMQGLLPPAPYPSFPEYPVPAYLNRSYSLNPLQVGSVPLEASFYVDRVSPMLIHQQNNYFAANYRAPLVINNPFYQKMQISNDNKVNQLANSSEQGQLYSATHLSNNRRSTKPIEIIEISDEQPQANKNTITTFPKQQFQTHKNRTDQFQKKPQKREYIFKNKKQLQRQIHNLNNQEIDERYHTDNLQTKIITRAAKKKISKQIKALRKLEKQQQYPHYDKRKSFSPQKMEQQECSPQTDKHSLKYCQNRVRKPVNKCVGDCVCQSAEAKPSKKVEKRAEVKIDLLVSAATPLYLSNPFCSLDFVKIRQSLLQRQND